jgi:hypothetical protein
VVEERSALAFVVEALERRAADQGAGDPARAERLRQRVHERAADLLDAWARIAYGYREKGVHLQYNEGEGGGAKALLHDFLTAEHEDLSPLERRFRANRSMRDVEPNVNLWMRSLAGVEVEDDDESGEGSE